MDWFGQGKYWKLSGKVRESQGIWKLECCRHPGVDNLEIDKSMLIYVRGARKKYEVHLENTRKDNSELEQKRKERKRKSDSIKLLESKKKKIEQETSTGVNDIQKQIDDLKKSKN